MGVCLPDHQTTQTTCQQLSKNYFAQLDLATGKPASDSDCARLMHIGIFAPWSDPSCRNADVGNDTLYHLCETHPLPNHIPPGDELPNAERIFASKMWLIGRSYAASPERYAYSKPERKPIEKDAEGYESFFDDIARVMFEGKPVYRGEVQDKTHDEAHDGVDTKELEQVRGRFKKLLPDLSELQSKRYAFSREDYLADIATLQLVQKAVTDFAGVLRKARYIRDVIISRKQGNTAGLFEENQFFPRSFSSKFLHFHLPHVVFIYDSKVEGILHASREIKKKGEVKRFFCNKSSFTIPIDTERPPASPDNNRDLYTPDARYASYSHKAFALANVIYNKFHYDETLLKALALGKWEASRNDPIPRYYSITRMTDSLIANSLAYVDCGQDGPHL